MCGAIAYIGSRFDQCTSVSLKSFGGDSDELTWFNYYLLHVELDLWVGLFCLCVICVSTVEHPFIQIKHLDDCHFILESNTARSATRIYCRMQ